MLSKPYPESSTGSQSPGFTSTASRSRIALLYSARFSRWTARAPRIRPCERGAVDRRFEKRRKRLRIGRLGTDARRYRRHVARLDLAEDFLPDPPLAPERRQGSDPGATGRRFATCRYDSSNSFFSTSAACEATRWTPARAWRLTFDTSSHQAENRRNDRNPSPARLADQVFQTISFDHILRVSISPA